MNSKFENKWNLWYHSLKDDWTINGYKRIYTIENIKDYWKLYNNWDKLGTINNKHFFIMMNDITPIWEDDNNINGACYSFKISNKIICNIWKNISYNLVSENLLNNNETIINGISISPKKYFCILKIWIKDKSYDNLKFKNDNIKNLPYIFKLNNENQ